MDLVRYPQLGSPEGYQHAQDGAPRRCWQGASPLPTVFWSTASRCVIAAERSKTAGPVLSLDANAIKPSPSRGRCVVYVIELPVPETERQDGGQTLSPGGFVQHGVGDPLTVVKVMLAVFPFQ